jgi:RNA polymerase sigma factor for flagellar operon FliA
LTENLALIKRVVAFVCRRHLFDDDDAEEFASIVNLKLMEDDFAVLRTYEQRSRFSTWINVVVQRMALDFRIAAWGKWHASAEAKRLGPAAVELEQLVHRDGRTPEAAFAVVMWNHRITREELQKIADRLPPREPRPRQVDVDEARLVAKPVAVDEALMERDRQRVAQQLSTLLSKEMRKLPDEDRLVLQLRFEGRMTVAQIARSLQVDQKRLYRQLEQHLAAMKKGLLENGIEPADVADLIGRDGPILEFDLRNRGSRPSNGTDEGATASTEVSQ